MQIKSNTEAENTRKFELLINEFQHENNVRKGQLDFLSEKITTLTGKNIPAEPEKIEDQSSRTYSVIDTLGDKLLQVKQDNSWLANLVKILDEVV